MRFPYIFLMACLTVVLFAAEKSHALVGVRNVFPVLQGVVYRGGGAGGMHPLGQDALNSLCREGFSTAVYLYATGFKGVTTTDCVTTSGRRNRLVYRQIDFRTGRKQILDIAYRAIMSPSAGRVFLHCWNGMHAVGEMSAVMLRQ